MSDLILQEPHSQGQEDLIYSDTNDVVFAGRRYGKTHSGVHRIIMSAAENPGLYWWVGLGWKSASLKRAWGELKAFTVDVWSSIGRNPYKYIREHEKEIRWPNGSRVWMRTAERKDSLAGEGIKGAVIDEFTLMDEAVWIEYLQGTLLDYPGWAMFIGVPKGQNWGYDLWMRARSGELDGWRGWHFPTLSNPWINPADLEKIRLNCPEKIFEQEYLAKVIHNAGLVFINVDECANSPQLTGPEKNHTYIGGLDWGKDNDYTVLTIYDLSERRQVHQIRINTIKYEEQLRLIKLTCRRFNVGVVVAEVNSMGEPLAEQLINDGVPVKKFFATNQSKRRIIEQFQVALERKQVRILDDRDFKQELKQFECHVTDKGNITYSAPTGKHDDTVIANCLAWSEIHMGVGITI